MIIFSGRWEVDFLSPLAFFWCNNDQLIAKRPILTKIASMVNNILSHVSHIPHAQERPEAILMESTVVNKRVVGKGVCKTNSTQEHLNADQKILK